MPVLRFLPLALLLAACEPTPPAPTAPPPPPAALVDAEAQAVVDRALAAHGAGILDDADVTFGFRGARFELSTHPGTWSIRRIVQDEGGGRIEDELGVDGLLHRENGADVPLSPAEAAAAESAVNSVAYFALLPYKLNDPAARKRLLAPATIGGRRYDVVEVTFDERGGGADWEDRFVYWFDARRHTLDYLAYAFAVNGGGTRFREATNPRTVGGVRVQDYQNYTADSTGAPFRRLDRYPDLLGTDQLRLLSTVALDSVRVVPGAR
jgi:hypothetical protein